MCACGRRNRIRFPGCLSPNLRSTKLLGYVNCLQLCAGASQCSHFDLICVPTISMYFLQGLCANFVAISVDFDGILNPLGSLKFSREMPKTLQEKEINVSNVIDLKSFVGMSLRRFLSIVHIMWSGRSDWIYRRPLSREPGSGEAAGASARIHSANLPVRVRG